MLESFNILFRSLIGLLSLALLAGCSLIVDGRITSRVTDCTSQANGTPCAGGDYCFASTCSYTICGDGIVNPGRGEECDDGNLLGGDGCQPVSCTHTCDGDTPCPDDGNPCNGPETCSVATHVCSSGPSVDSVACDASGTAGTCASGYCVPAGCGDGSVVPPEQCDPPGVGCLPNCNWECEADYQCPVADPCVNDRLCDVGTHACQDLGPRSCDDLDPCTADGCSAGLGGCYNSPLDADGDGYSPMDVCGAASALLPSDCDDANASVHPTAAEQCNGVDDDCNMIIDDNVVLVDCYPDVDADGYPSSTLLVNACMCPAGSMPARTDGLYDCNDFTSAVNPEVAKYTYFATPVCPDGTAPVSLNPNTGVGTCGDNSIASYDYDCSGNAEPELPATQADACNASTCDGGGWVTAVPSCGATDQFADCYFQFACLIALPRTRTQHCR